MRYTINDTSLYHINDIESLGWELTVCNMLEGKNNPCKKILKKDGTFGNHLLDYLNSKVSLNKIKSILEVGGGYGFISRDFFKFNENFDITLIDISSFLLEKQRETLSDYKNAKFINKNFFDVDSTLLNNFDLAILNENIGDFQTAINLTRTVLTDDVKDKNLLKINQLIEKYSLEIPDYEFAFNLGAIEAVEKLCSANIPNIYISEHSAEANVPAEFQDLIKISSAGFPEKIELKGHHEYTIKFSHLIAVAENFGYEVTRGSYTKIVPYNHNSLVNFIFTSNSAKDEHEIIRQFVEDLYKYEFIFLQKNRG